MSFINGSPFAGLGSTSTYEFERPQNESSTNDAIPGSAYGDRFRSNPISLPAPSENYGRPSSSDPSSIYSAILQNIASLLAAITSYFGGNPQASAQPGYATQPQQPQSPQTAFTNASASSWGDPHDTFDGTTSSGTNVSGNWDNMKGHDDLLDSDSFRGGYRVSTTTTTPDSRGVTLNANATVTTHGGNDSVTLKNDGSYQITEDGRNVSLTQGQAMQLGRNETVTLNADKSLTIVDTNHSGSSLTTTFSANNGGVDVKATGSNVDLGGYLVNKSDDAAQSRAPVSWAPVRPIREYGDETEPLGAGEIEFA